MRETNYLGNPNVRGADVEHPWTKAELVEYKKCLVDPKYFAKKYCKVIHLDKGLIPFNLYPYQEKMFDSFTDNRFNIVLACRQSGKSIAVVAYLLWYAIFKGEQVVGVLANKNAIAREMLARITLMLENLPFFLQPGCTTLNKGSIGFSNNSRIIAAATSSSSIRGMSLNLLIVYLDEFAFVDNASEFYTSTYSVISAAAALSRRLAARPPSTPTRAPSLDSWGCSTRMRSSWTRRSCWRCTRRSSGSCRGSIRCAARGRTTVGWWTRQWYLPSPCNKSREVCTHTCTAIR